jgi:hypothetical protein
MHRYRPEHRSWIERADRMMEDYENLRVKNGWEHVGDYGDDKFARLSKRFNHREKYDVMVIAIFENASVLDVAKILLNPKYKKK